MNRNVADVVIGAVYGDEGKGLMTDFLTEQRLKEGKTVAVVRFNGGAQAGHTVVRDGIRHVFKHLGSGTIAGADTILSKHFCLNPIAFFQELEELNSKINGGIKTKIYVDTECMITTPYDIFINQALEKKRGENRHGSCGMGIGITVERYEKAPSNTHLRPWDFFDKTHVYIYLNNIRSWFVKECERLELTDDPNYYLLLSDGLMDKFYQDCVDMFDIVRQEKVSLYQQHDHFVFEGAQGLGLDQLLGTFPHVTRSFTGMRNVVDIMANKLDQYEFNVHYMTRAYATRHGAGPMCGEVSHKLPKVVDETNIPNEFQGALRFGDINLDELKERIDNDLFVAKVVSVGKAKINPTITITCMDQLEDKVDVIHGCRRKSTPVLLPRVVEHATNIRVGHLSYGPTAANVKTVEV